MMKHVLCLALSTLLLALCMPVTAQQPHIPRIGYLAAHPADRELQPFFLQGLHALGYTEGHNILIEQRQAAFGEQDKIRALAAELVRLQVDVIVVSAGANDMQVAREAVTTIPFVFIESPDPVGLGLVESLARPGGNATGQSAFHSPLAAKRLELLKEVAPAATRIAFVWLAGSLAASRQWQDLQAAAPGVGVTLLPFEVAGSDDVDRALTAVAQAGVEALYVHPTVTSIPYGRSRVLAFAVQHRLPAMYHLWQVVEAGGLMSYGASFPALWQRAATYVDKILKGTKPAELPVEQPMKFELVLNLRTAAQMGLTIPRQSDSGVGGHVPWVSGQNRGANSKAPCIFLTQIALNNALEPTPYSLRSFLASAFGRGSPPVFGVRDLQFTIREIKA
jgi:putative ABC transport system substrate-binding protein